jgi:phage terminase small subunit
MTPRQQRFVDEYLLDLNATQAAIRAGYRARTAEQQGPRLLGNVEIATAVRAAQRAAWAAS